MDNKFEKIKNDIVDEIINIFPDDKIVFASIFGSWGREENSPTSDIDLLIVFRNDFDFYEISDSFKPIFLHIAFIVL